MQGPVATLQWLIAVSHRGVFSDLSPLVYLRYLFTVFAVSAFCYPVGSRKWLRRRLRLVGQSAIRWRAVHGWMAAAGSCELLRHVVTAKPRLLERPFRPLGALGLGFRDRVRFVLEHYSMLHKLVPADLCGRIYLFGGIETLQVDDRYALRLADAGPNIREGELAFYWLDKASGVCLAQLSFYLAQGEDGPELFVGGLQGPAGEASRELIRLATKTCDGLRPKDAVMEALLAFAASVCARRIVAVSRMNHVGQQRRTPRVIHADYDGFWMEADGVALPGGNIEVPVCQPRRDITELPSKKRSAYRRKIERAEAVQATVREWLAARPAAAASPEMHRPVVLAAA